MGSGGGNTTTVQKADPWPVSVPSLTRGLGDLNQVYDQGRLTPTPFGGPRVAGFGGETMQAQNMMLGQAGQPNASGSAQSSLIDMMQGTNGIYRDLGAVREEALGGAIPAAVAQFAGNGMTDSSQAMDTVGRAATNAIAPIEYGAFLQQQQNQLRGAALAPSVDQAGYLPAQMVGAVGGQRDAMSQAQIDALMQQHYEAADGPFNNLQRYSQLAMGYGGQGGSQSMTQPGASMGSRVAGAGMTGLGAYGALAGMGAGGPLGAGLAGALALAGLF